MKTIYVIIPIVCIILIISIVLITILLVNKNIKEPLKYGDYIMIKKSDSDYYWSAQKTNQSPWIWGESVDIASKFQILDSSGNSSGKNILNGDMIKLKVNNQLIRYPLLYHPIIDCSPFWNNFGNYKDDIPQDIIDKLNKEENIYTEDLFQLQSVNNNKLIYTNTPLSILQNKNRKCGSLDNNGNPSPAPVCKNENVNNKFMFLTGLEGYYVDNCNYGGNDENCSLCEQDKTEWIIEKLKN